MKLKHFNSNKTPKASGGYSQAVEVSTGERTLYISGQIPVTASGHAPATFKEQAQLAWANIKHQLEAADMTLDNIVRHTTYLSDRIYRDKNAEVRREVLGKREPALTVIIATIYDEAWLLEIEAVAVA